MASVEFREIGKNYNSLEVISGLNLLIDDGEFVALLGPSGCGKTTSLMMLAGITQPSRGELLFDGQVVNEVDARDRNIGIVFQSYALYPHMTVAENIMFPLRFQKLARREALRRMQTAADLVHVGELVGRRPRELSGGQQQRVALARALVKGPELLLLDEPLSNLDASLRLAMRSEIKALHEETGVTTVLVTHDQIEATTLSDRVVCLNDGRVQQVGTADDLYLMPANLFVARFIGSPPMNLLELRVADAAASAGDAVLEFVGPVPDEATVGLRPEHVGFSETGIAGRVAQLEPMGREVLAVVETAFGNIRALERAAIPSNNLGANVHLAFDPEDSLVFDTRAGELIPGARARLRGYP